MEALKNKHRASQTADVKAAATSPPSCSTSQPRRRKTRRSAPVERPSVPAWMLDTPMHSKIPLVGAPNGKIMLYTTAFCEKLFATPTSLKFDPRPQGLDMMYRSLHDPHLRGYFTHPKMYSHLRKSGFLTPCGMVKCGLKQFNEYHQYVKQIHLEKLTQERRQMRKKTRSRDDRSSHGHQHHKLNHKKRLTPTWTDSWHKAAYRPAKHQRRASSTKSISRPPPQEKKSEKIRSASKQKSISKTKTIRDGVMKAHTALEHRRKAVKSGTGQIVVKTQAHERQFLQLKKRLDEEMEREKELERRKIIKKAKREMKLEEQWERREIVHELQQAQKDDQRHEDETKSGKVKVMRRRMAEAHRAKQQGSPHVFESIRDARAKLVAEREAIIARRLDKRLYKIREKYNRRHRRQMAIYRQTTKILNGKLQDHEEQLDAGKTSRKHRDVNAEAANASTSRLLSLIHSTSRDSISSSDDSFVFTPLVKEKPFISITDQVLSVTSLDYRQSPECRAEEQTGPVSIMQDVYLADESGEEEDNTKTQERDREHLVSVGKGVAVKAWPERDHDEGEEAEQSLHWSPEDSDERSSIGTKSTSSRGSTSSISVPEKLIQGNVGSGNEREEPGSEDDENGEEAAEEEYSMEEDDSWTDSEFWEYESDTNLNEGSKPTAVEEDKVISEEIEQETKKENESTQQEQEEKNQPSSTRKVKVKDAEKLELEREEENSEKSQFAKERLGTAQDFQAEEVVNKTECPDEVTENKCTMGATSQREKDDGREYEVKANKIVATVLEGSAVEINSKDNNCRLKKLCRQIDIKMEGSRHEERLGDKINQGEDTQTGTNEEENVEKLESDSILLANVMDIFEEVEQEMHHHDHHNHEQHHHEEHHHHQEHLPEAEQDEDKKQTESECSSSSCSSSSSSESEEGGDIIGVVENEVIAEETSVTSLKGCLSGKFVTGLQEVVKETENHRKVFEGAVMPVRHHSATSSASSKVSINVTAAVLSADSLKVDSSGRLIHQDVDSHNHTKPEHKISATDIPTDDKPAAAHDDESASKESSHHHYSNIVPIYHNKLIHVSEDLIDSNLSAISMKPNRHHKVPSSYSTGSRNSFRNIFRPDMTFCQGSAKCLKDTLVRELSKHSSDKMDEYCGILDVEQEDVTAHHSDEELVTIEEAEGVCYLPKRRLFKARHTIEEPVSEQDEEEVPTGGHITGISNAAVSAEERQASECSDDTGKPPNLMGNCQSDPTCEQRTIKDESETNSSLGDGDGGIEAMEASTDHPDDQSDDASPDNKQTRRNETQVLDEGIASHEAGPPVFEDQRDARTLQTDGKGSLSEEGNIEDIPVLDKVKDGSIQTPEGVLTNGPCEVNSGEGVNIREQDNNGQQASTEDLAIRGGQQASTEDLAIRGGQNNTCDEEPTNRDEMAGEPASSDEQIDGVTLANKVEQTDSGQPRDNGKLDPDNGFELANKGEPTNTGERAAIDEKNIISGEPSIEEQANSRELTTKEEASRGEQNNSKEPTNEDHGQLADDGEQANNREPTSSGKRTNDEEQAKCDKLSDGEGKATKANSEEQANREVHTDDIQQGQTQPEQDSRPGSSQASQLSFIPSSSISGGDDLVSSSSSFDEIGAQSPLPNCVPESFYIGTSDDSTLGAAATRSAALVKDAAPVPNMEQSHQDSIDPEPGFHSPPLKEVSSHPSPSQSKSGSSHKSGSMLSTVIRKLSSVLSVGRRRSSRVHPGDDTSAETKTDTTEAEGATVQDQ